MERVLLTGPHSCGKTTLANALLSSSNNLFPGLELHPPVPLSEVAREVMRTQGFTRDDVGKRAIMDAQMSKEASISVPYISDRCILDPMAYSLWRDGSTQSTGPLKVNAEAFTPTPSFRALRDRHETEEVLERYRDSNRTLIVLLEPVEEFAVDDATRRVVENMDEWTECLYAFERVLMESGITNFKRLGRETVELQSRVEKVKQWIREASF